MTQRWVENVTATEKSTNTNNINSDMASFSIRETTGFKIQSRDISNPPYDGLISLRQGKGNKE